MREILATGMLRANVCKNDLHLLDRSTDLLECSSIHSSHRPPIHPSIHPSCLPELCLSVRLFTSRSGLSLALFLLTLESSSFAYICRSDRQTNRRTDRQAYKPTLISNCKTHWRWIFDITVLVALSRPILLRLCVYTVYLSIHIPANCTDPSIKVGNIFFFPLSLFSHTVLYPPPPYEFFMRNSLFLADPSWNLWLHDVRLGQRVYQYRMCVGNLVCVSMMWTNP